MMGALVVAAALILTGCSKSPPPVPAVKVLEIPELPAVPNAVALSPDGRLVVIGDLDGDLIARSVPSGAERWKARVHPPGATRRIDGLVFSPDGSLLASTGQDAPAVELWRATNGRRAGLLKIAQSRAAVFHPKERTLVVAAATAIHVVDVKQAEVTRTLANAHQGQRVDAVAFSADGRVLATASDRGLLKLWNWPALTLRKSVSIASSLEAMAPVSLALSRDGARVAANGTLGQVQVIDAVKGREERAFANAPEAPGDAMHAELRQSLVFTADGNWLLAPDAHDRGVRILHVPRGDAYPLIRSDGPFYKTMAIALPASLVALIRPGDAQGRGPHGLEVWRFTPPTGTAVSSAR